MSNNTFVQQVGGSHYASNLQHWDLVVNIQLGYLEACGTKYLTRAHKKNGLEDVRKSLSYAQKLLLLVQAGKIRPAGSPAARALRHLSNLFDDSEVILPLSRAEKEAHVKDFFELNAIPDPVREAFMVLACWETEADLVDAIRLIEELISAMESSPILPA